MIRIETHAHTSEVGPCGRMPAKELVARFADASYAALVVTDHLSEHWNAHLSLTERADEYLSGYRAAREEGEKRGVRVLLGAELRLSFLGDEDFLAYGLSEEQIPSLMEKLDRCPSICALHEVVNGMGGLLYQAHPFRVGLTAQNPLWLDGIEVYNGNPRHDSRNGDALAYATRHRLSMLSGSDAHQVPDVARGGIALSEMPADFTAYLRATPDPVRIEDGRIL
ncbi:MAG: PHP-associated domain-containing protein [Christensenellales bacterium]|jgi:hypothetical protein